MFPAQFSLLVICQTESMKRHPYLPNLLSSGSGYEFKEYRALLLYYILLLHNPPSNYLIVCTYVKEWSQNWVFFSSFFSPFSFLFSFHKQDNWQAVGYTQVQPSGTGHSKAFIDSPMGLNPRFLWYQTGVIPLSHHPWGNWVLEFICILLPTLQSFRVFRKEVARYKRKKDISLKRICWK